MIRVFENKCWNKKVWLRGAHIAIVIALMSTSLLVATPVQFSGNGNYYEFVTVQTTWDSARSMAAGMSWQGNQGHLATITSAAENNFIATTFASAQGPYFGWIAGYEPNDDGVWKWGAGPDSGIQFSNVASPTAPFNYANWGGPEPNDVAQGEDFVAINLGATTFAGVVPSQWIDSPNPNPSDPIFGFIVEYEGEPTGSAPSAPEPGRGFFIGGCKPNPFNHTTTISFMLPATSDVTIVITDAVGTEIARPVDHRRYEGGEYQVDFDGRGLGAGTYFCKIIAAGMTKTESIMLVR